MTDRVKGFTVVLDDDYRIDDVEEIRKAISMVKGVLDVQAVITTPADWINRTRFRIELITKLMTLLHAEIKSPERVT